MEVFAKRKLGPEYTNQPGMRMTRDEMNWENDRDDLSEDKRRITMGGNAIEHKGDCGHGHHHHKLHAGQRVRPACGEHAPSLYYSLQVAPPYQTQREHGRLDRHRPSCARVAALAEQGAYLAHSNEKHLTLLRDDISGIFSVTSLIGGDGSIESSIVDDSTTIASASVGGDNESSVGGGDGMSLGDIEEEEGTSVGSVESLTKTATSQPQMGSDLHRACQASPGGAGVGRGVDEVKPIGASRPARNMGKEGR